MDPSAASSSRPPPSIPGPRSSTIPRLSRLPVLKPSAPRSQAQAKPAIDSVDSKTNAPTNSRGPRVRRPLTTTTSTSTAPAPASTVHEHLFKKPAAPSSFRQSRPQPQKRVASASKTAAEDAVGSLDGFRSASRASSRAGSRAGIHGSDESVIIEGPVDPRTPPTRPKSRPSLVERTMESIAKIPQSPALRRRRSSFFNPESPMPSRPASAMGGRLVGEQSDARADSPTKTLRVKPRVSLLPGSTPTIVNKRSVSTATPRQTSRATSPTKASAVKSRQTVKPTASASKATSGRPFSGSKTVSGRMTKPRPALVGLFNEPNSRSSQPNIVKPSSRGPARTSAKKSVESPSPARPSPNAAKSSAALREQIRKARAERKSLAGNQNGQADTKASSEFDDGPHKDPFNQLPKDETSHIRRRVDSARTDGRLNIAAMELKEFPEEIMKMYDYEYNKQASEIAWNEVVDLVRFIAADNEIESIPNEVFPDTDQNTLGQDDDVKGPQFGGIELLDLHGNILSSVPIGLRRLERLTTLNLSRNRLTNDCLETIGQITSLKDLKMADNNLTGELGAAIFKLPELEVLEVQGNKLSSLPDELSASGHLRILNVSNNRLSYLPMTELSKLPLVQLLASKNQLSGTLFPESTFPMTRLQILEVSINSISSLSKGGISLPALQSLDIAFNRIAFLPDVSSWTALKAIIATDNKISSMPEGFTSLKTLRSADFTGNDLPRLDPRVALMDGLESFLIAANPIRERKFLAMSTAELKKDLKARLSMDEPGNEVD